MRIAIVRKIRPSDCDGGWKRHALHAGMMIPPLPPNCRRVRLVQSFDELASARFSGDINALCWPRVLPGDYAEVASLLPRGGGITPLDDAQILDLPLSHAGRTAARCMIEDQERLRALGLEPVLDFIDGGCRDTPDAIVATDVFSWHVDSAPLEADTWLCTYHGPCSEGLLNEEARRRADIPETRAALLRSYGGADDSGFCDFLNEHCYDLHYLPLPGAEPYVFGTGNLWRIATEYPGSPVAPCIHRAPGTLSGETRLLLLS
jgi:hypothetical protein